MRDFNPGNLGDSCNFSLQPWMIMRKYQKHYWNMMEHHGTVASQLLAWVAAHHLLNLLLFQKSMSQTQVWEVINVHISQFQLQTLKMPGCSQLEQCCSEPMTRSTAESGLANISKGMELSPTSKKTCIGAGIICIFLMGKFHEVCLFSPKIGQICSAHAFSTPFDAVFSRFAASNCTPLMSQFGNLA